MDNFLQNISQQVGTHLPGILTAVAVLVIGWIIAHIVARMVRLGLNKSGLGARLSSMVSSGGQYDVSRIIGKVVFYMLMLFVFVTFFNVLDLPVVSEPLKGFLDQIFEFAPRIFSAGILGIIAFVLARVLRQVSQKGLEAADIDTRVSSLGADVKSVAKAANQVAETALHVEDDDELDLNLDDDDDIVSLSDDRGTVALSAGDDTVQLSKTIPEAIYWVVIALFIPAILGALQMPGLLEPVQEMFTKMFDYLPNIIGAAAILFVGSFIAKIIRQVASNLAASLGVNQLANKLGVGGALSNRKVSDILGVVVFAMIMLPIVVAALNTLDIEAVTKPAGDILARLTSLIPGFLGAGIVLGIAYFIGKIISDIVVDLLSGVGFDSVPEKIGLNLSNASSTSSPSKLAGKLTLVSIIVLSALQALPMMGLESIAVHLETFAGYAVQVLVGLVILALGMYIANFVANLIRESGVQNSNQLSMIARVAIMIFAGGFGLQHMGLSASIVNVAFSSLLGGLGLAAAIAFGWGGRDAAKRILDRMVS